MNKPPEGATKLTIEDMVVSYATAMSAEDVQETMKEMGFKISEVDTLCRVLIAQTWVINTLLEGPLKGVKFYFDNATELGLH